MAGTMHLSERDLVLYQMVEGEVWEGDVSSPSGAWTTVTITEEMRTEVVLTMGHDLGEALIGWWLIVEDDQGFLHFYPFGTERARDIEVSMREALYGLWTMED